MSHSLFVIPGVEVLPLQSRGLEPLDRGSQQRQQKIPAQEALTVPVGHGRASKAGMTKESILSHCSLFAINNIRFLAFVLTGFFLAAPPVAASDPLATFLLGSKHYWGDGVPEDKQKAQQLYTTAADQGLAVAQYALGKMDMLAHKDRSALEWFQKAAQQGHIEAQFELGQLYLKTDTKQAAIWLTKAAEEGHGGAAYLLSQLYALKDPKKSRFWRQEAASQRYPLASPVEKSPPVGMPLTSFREAACILATIPPTALVVFDLDDTLVVSRDTTIPPALTESSVRVMIHALQAKGIRILVITNSMVADGLRHNELLNVGLDFGNPDPIIFDTFAAEGGFPPLFSNGILYTNGVSKGDLLSAWLDKTHFTPSLIVFFDDRAKNLQDVADAAHKRHIRFIGFLYTRVVDQLNRGMTYQDIHEQLLRRSVP